jgi:hypothetical protein
LKIVKNFRSKVGKKVVSSATDWNLRRKSCDTDPAPGSKNPDFFGREILKTGKFFGRKLKNVKKVGVKFENPKNFPVEIFKNPKKFRAKVRTAGFFRKKIKIAGKILEVPEFQVRSGLTA